MIFPPAGGVQVYEVAPATFITEYVFESPGQTLAVPPVVEIVPGLAGGVQLVTEVC